MGDFSAVFAIVVGLALATTKIVDFIRNVLDKNASFPKWVWNIVAFVVGVAFCVGWQHGFMNDLISQVPALSNVHFGANSDYLVSGIIVGAGAGVWHELLDALSSFAKGMSARVPESTSM